MLSRESKTTLRGREMQLFNSKVGNRGREIHFLKPKVAQLQHLLNKISLKISLFLFCRFSLGTTDFPIPLNEVLSCSTFGRVWKYNVAACKFPLPDR